MDTPTWPGQESACHWALGRASLRFQRPAEPRPLHRRYQAPATFGIAVFAPVVTTFFILPRLDAPVPTIKLGTVFSGRVSQSAFYQARPTRAPSRCAPH
jgi:hypothetical protein